MSNLGVHYTRYESTARRDTSLTEPISNEELTETTSLLGKEGGGFEGKKVSLRQGDVSKGVDELRQSSVTRLGEGRGLGSKVLNIIGGIILFLPVAGIKAAASIVGSLVGAVIGGASKLLAKGFGVEKENNQPFLEWRGRLGVPMEGSILRSGKDVAFVGESMSLEEALDGVRQRTGSNVPLDEIKQYVAMGERIVHALSGMDDTPPPTKVDVYFGEGEGGVRIKSNLDTTRAISWYLQAKALVDNTGHGQGGYLNEGAMITKDPGNKLFSFLQSSNNTYGRVSTHMEERSQSRLDNNIFSTLWTGGFDGFAFSGIGGQPLQYGIEDYDGRMPSKGGSLLFDKLAPSGGDHDKVPELYLKWENVGTPFAFGGGSSSMTRSIPDDMWNQKGAPWRFVLHSVGAAGNKDPEGYRGEKFTKGEAKGWLDQFKTQVNGLRNVDPETKKNMIKHVETYGAGEMNVALDLMLGTGNEEVSFDEKEGLKQLKEDFGRWLDRMGPDLGIARKGQEIHVHLTEVREQSILIREESNEDELIIMDQDQGKDFI